MSLRQQGSTTSSEICVGGTFEEDMEAFLASRNKLVEAVKANQAPEADLARFNALKSTTTVSSAPQLNLEKLPVKTRKFYMKWEGTGRQLKQQAVLEWRVPQNNLTIFRSSDGGALRTGNLSRVIIVEARAGAPKSDLPIDTFIQAEGMKGRSYTKEGNRTPLVIERNSCNAESAGIIHRINDDQLHMAELRLTSIDEEVLKKEYKEMEPHFNEETQEEEVRCCVRRGGEITRVLMNPENLEKLNVELKDFELVEKERFFFMDKDLVDVCVKSILKKVEGVRVPFVNFSKWSVELCPVGGLSWDNIDVHPAFSGANGTLNEYAMDKHYQISVPIELDYVIASGGKWDTAMSN